MEFLKLLSIGLVLGAVVVIPGVSTGTLAAAFGIYERLIAVITPNVKKILAEWKFWLPLAAGGAAGLFAFSRIITGLFSDHPVPTRWFFIGLIAGSVPLFYQKSKPQGRVLPDLPVMLCAVCALAVILATTFLNPAGGAAVHTALTPALFAALAAAGVLGAVSLIVPGISGSFVLLAAGLYVTVVQALADFNLPLLLPLTGGAAAGLFAGAALVRFLLEKAPQKTYGAVLGLLAGAVIALYPGGLSGEGRAIFSIISLIAGASVSFFSSSPLKALSG